MDQRAGNVFEETRTKTHKAKAERIQQGWGFGCVGSPGTRSRMQKQSDKHESCSRLADWLVYLTCMVHCDVSFPNQKHSQNYSNVRLSVAYSKSRDINTPRF